MKSFTLNNGIRFSDADIVNPSDYDPDAKGKLDSPRCGNLPVLWHDHGFTVGIVFAETLQDALDILADSGKIEGLEISPEDFATGDYGPEENPTGPVSYLGNNGKPYDIDGLNFLVLHNPPFSFTGLYREKESNK